MTSIITYRGIGIGIVGEWTKCPESRGVPIICLIAFPNREDVDMHHMESYDIIFS